MLYPELFASLEKVRWSMSEDIPWKDFEPSKLSEEQARTIKMNAITEWSALPATEMFLRDNRHDSDFSAFMSVWFFEEQKHSLVLMEYLRRFRHPRLKGEQLIRGATHLHFAPDGRVRLHRDYWDAAEELYEKLPVVGTLVRLLRRRAAA